MVYYVAKVRSCILDEQGLFRCHRDLPKSWRIISMKQLHYFCLIIALGLLSSCSGGASESSTPQATIGGIVKPNLAQTQTAPVNVLTNRYDNARTGANLNETILNHANVNVDQFGKLFTRTVEGDIYAQPLYVQDVETPDKQRHNIVYIATMHNMVYAFDADNPSQGNPLWVANLGTPFTQKLLADIPGGEDGILSTPVIDLDTQTIYLVTRNWENKALYKLHALDIRSGQPRAGSPVTIELKVPSKSWRAVDGIVTMDSSTQLQRPGLLLAKGNIYVAFGASNDRETWFGWVGAYDAKSLKPTGVFNISQDGEYGGIWQGGGGLSSDGEYIYLAGGNGTFDAQTGGHNYSSSIVKLSHRQGIFSVEDWFTPYNFKDMNEADLDMGSIAVMLIPHTNMAITGAKDGNLYIVNLRNFGHFNPDKNANQQVIPAGSGRVYANSIYWDVGPQNKPTYYAWADFDVIHAFTIDTVNNKLFETIASDSTIDSVGMPIGGMSLSANGTQMDSGIIWATIGPRVDKKDLTGVIYAFDATDLKHILWHSELNADQDSLGKLAKFNPPIVANGKVYVSTFSNQLVVYGLLN